VSPLNAIASAVSSAIVAIQSFTGLLFTHQNGTDVERELISERTRAALGAAKARGARLGGDRGLSASCPDSGAAAVARREAAERMAHQLLLEVDRLRDAGVTSMQALALALTGHGVPAPGGGGTWTHTTVARLLKRTGIWHITAEIPVSD
jgi:DNA invertase Pin-like site-specific DNA recombinase